ncbi:MAG: EF2563 family selenium-dependent molybdenum hydroxylase system protein [Nitrospinaceae bacterium]|nr:EF2563 family selenium-dependent molybdenum hydroxylase system protein [Nitrospinaceae bacterium]MBT3433979.1 EF2563 family selenium-dependent molybdenum hydroxylase system protein [Nitrospinaceae bacterium]MBT4430333.1 EF2563 family selenium-dependent molybdenum hydroxylase system protein [Nitrospinaceae bacterium]MBT5368609.1 EF2563 family selenium-dependent molybdenum hydroxylase system protein [Nitrospinaceae bacterium]MBT5948204.1 EF2563 family selenium-dependent molybdenum hydroxylase 
MNTRIRATTPKGNLVIVKGGGDLATGIIHRLWRSGFPVISTEVENPTMVRRTVSFAECLYSGRHVVEGVTSAQAEGNTPETQLASARALLAEKILPVIIDPEAKIVALAKPAALVDAIIAKRNLGTRIDQADVVVGIGPGFTAGVDAHAVIETARGHDIGRVITDGGAEPNTGVPGPIGGYTTERLLRSPTQGVFEPRSVIGDIVKAGDTVAIVNGQAVTAQIDGVLRGLLRDGIEVPEGFKVGDVDPRAKPEHCNTISDKSRAIGGGVLEAIMMFLYGVETAAELTN